MRKVIVWEYVTRNTVIQTDKDGNLIKKPSYQGDFETWGLANDGEGSFTVAIVRKPDGMFVSVIPELIQDLGEYMP